MSDANTEHEVERQEVPALELSPAVVFVTIVVLCFAALIVGSAFFPQHFGG